MVNQVENYLPKVAERGMIGGWRWLERRLALREMMLRDDQKREKGCAPLDFLSAPGVAA